MAPYLTAAEIRARVPALLDVGAFADVVLTDLVSEFEEIAEAYCGRAFVVRTATEKVRGSGPTGRIQLSYPDVVAVSAVTVDGVAQTVTTHYEVDIPNGLVILTSPTAELVAVTYTYGPSTVPAWAKRACRLYVRACALRDASDLGRDVIRQGYEGGSTQYSTPDWNAGRPTGYLDVDRLLNAARDGGQIGVA